MRKEIVAFVLAVFALGVLVNLALSSRPASSEGVDGEALFFGKRSVNIAGLGGDYAEVTVSGEGNKKKIALLALDQPIDTGTAVSSTGLTVEDFVSVLAKAKKDDAVKAAVLYVNSPGGSVYESYLLSQAVKDFRESGKPLYVSIGGMGASGAYYTSAFAQKIFATPESLVGSIGVIAEVPVVTGLMDKVGIRVYTFKTGEYKDSGSPFRDMDDKDRAYVQGIIDDMFHRFIQTVSEGRGIPAETVRTFADGRVFPAAEAQRLGLVDGIASLEQVIRLAEAEAKISEGKAKIVTYTPKRDLFDLLSTLPAFPLANFTLSLPPERIASPLREGFVLKPGKFYYLAPEVAYRWMYR
ncbi:signal peptide peptidase SppA [Brockia lithotrophica]|uniref:Signal peptide peptidase A n=1 Tax=Brockia lithotrophica TaxID=933949 RepID=A0A660KVJ3_9BACL|nr:signal peptide peptidase SppA [Brockia lithotrophica]RKQ84147.1 signal peptide peptidase A [Brockia lithotrophica]